MSINAEGLALIKKWEGYHRRLPDGSCRAYLDTLVKPAYRSPGYKGLWTIGYGCTEGVYEGLVWSEKEAEKALLVEINKHAKAVDRLIADIKDVDENQRAALISFSYNLGPGVLAKSTLLKKFKQGDEEGAAKEFLKYKRAGGKVYKGLLNRRKDEAKLFLKHTPKQIKDGSTKIDILKHGEGFLTTLGIGGIISWNTLKEVRDFATDNTGIVIMGVAAVAYTVYKLVKYTVTQKTIKDYEEGRYVPSKLTEDVLDVE